MPTKKNEKGEYLPDITPNQIRYRQFDSSVCKPNSFVTVTPQNKAKFKNRKFELPKPPSYKKSKTWDEPNLSLVLCYRTDIKKQGIQSIREPNTEKNRQDIK